jgi:signal transduction histidine kinase
MNRLLSIWGAGLLTGSVISDLPRTCAAATNEVLTTAVELLSLTPEQAGTRMPVSVTGVVTVAEPNWGGRFFVQDSTGGVFVNNEADPQPEIGDVVQVTGVSHAGGYAPDIISPHFKKLGTAPLPQAEPVSVEQLMSGAEDGQRVEVSGVVRSAHVVGPRLALELAAGGYRFRAFPPSSTNIDPNSLLDARVRLRGTAAASFNFPLRHLLTVVIFAPQASDLIIDQLPGSEISRQPFIPLNAIAQYHRDSSPGRRIRVKGVVTYQRRGEDIFLHDETGGLQVKCRGTNVITPGQIIEAIGFPGLERFLPILQDATLIPGREPGKPILAEKVSFTELMEGLHHSELISLEGKLLDRSLGPRRMRRSLWNDSGEDILTLHSSNYVFRVVAPATKEFEELAAIPIGSLLSVSGICLLEATEDGTIESFQVLLPDAGSIRILQRPSWWTPQRLLTGLGILLAGSILGTTWIVMILRRNSALQASIAEKLTAQEELRKAHDLLEWRVHERTKELSFETGARKEAEVRVEAILAERTRIAQELHDTLLQGFTGIGLKLDALTSRLPPSLSATKEELQKLLEQSDEYMREARRSVWKLRSPSLEKHGDFATALMKVSERALQGTGIQLNCLVEGTARKIAHDAEANLLRICEEAVANAVKHARPTQVEVTLHFADKELRLRIRDNGRGFNPKSTETSKAGHFGLLGVRERTKSLAGDFVLNSQPGQGTEIIVRVPG